MYVPSFALPIYKTTCHTNLTSAAAAGAGAGAGAGLLLHCVLLVGPARCFFLFLPTLLRKLHGDGCCYTEPSETFRVRPRYDYEKNMRVVTPRCAAAAVVSAVVLRQPTKEYTHRCSMMHRRLTTAGIEVAPHYHQLLVRSISIKYRAVAKTRCTLLEYGQSLSLIHI